MTIELPKELEAILAARAEAQGMPLSKFVSDILQNAVKVQDPSQLSIAERLAIWNSMWKDFPNGPLLSDEAISRESMYPDRL